MTLSSADIQTFIRDGYVAVPDAFPSALADRCRAIGLCTEAETSETTAASASPSCEP